MEMSDQESPWTNGGGSGDYPLEPDEAGAPQVVSKAVQEDGPGHNANDRKRNRSSDSDSARSSDSTNETTTKKPKVADDISFELSEKVSIPTVEKDVIEDQSSNNNSNQSGLGKKSIRQQVEDLVAERGMIVEYEFIQPPGYEYNIGQQAPSANYKVHLKIVEVSKLEDGSEASRTVQLFSGLGTQPYEAIRTSSKRARDYLTNLNGEFPQSNNPTNGDANNLLNNGDSVKDTDEESNQEVDAKENKHKNERVNDDHRDSESSDEDTNAEDDDSRTGDDDNSEAEIENKDTTKWILSLQSFFSKAFAPKLDSSVSIKYNLLDQSDSKVRVRCSIGNLAVESESSSFDIAKNDSAKKMMDKIESVISSKGDIIKVIAPPPPFRDETIVSDEDSKDGGHKVTEAETLDSSDEETEVAAFKVAQRSLTSDHEPGPSDMMPGVEYCMAFMRTDRPTERPIVMDVANIGRRTRCGVARMLLSSLQDGDKSDEEEEEGRMLETFQEMMALAGSLSDRSKVKLAEMFSRSSLGPIQRQLLGMMPGMLPPQPQYPVHPKHRLLPATGYQPPQPAEPPKPVIQPLKNLCQYPLPGQIEGVGAVTVSLEDYKTLAVGTFLNDVIIDFYLKHLQYSKLNEKDKNSAHIFTTFWFSRLTSKPSPIEARKDPVIRRHDRVKRWTRKVNIFEKDFVVVPINENYHWYLAIICYPGLVGCQSVDSEEKCSQPAQQRNRRRAKDKIKKIKAKMNALPRKDMSDERDEPLASEDEVEHEDDSVDVEMWKNRYVEWEKQEVIRKAEEERRMIEMERQRAEYEERMRQYQEEQKRLYEQQLREQEELMRRQLEEQAEDLGEEEEAWDDENLDEDGNPIEDNYDDGMMEDYNEYGEPVEMVTVPQGMFSDAGDYKTSVDILGAAFGSVRGEAMAADWDDWGEEVAMDTENVVMEVLRDTIDTLPVFGSMVCHSVATPTNINISGAASLLTHSVTQAATQEAVLNLEVNEEQCLSSAVAHTVSAQTTSSDVHVAAINHRLFDNKDQDDQESSQIEGTSSIAQVDGMAEDSSSDEDMEQDDDDDSNDEHKVPNPQVSRDETSQSAGDDDSIMSVDEVRFNQGQDNSQVGRSESDTEEEIERKEDSDSSSEEEDNNDTRGEIFNRNDDDDDDRSRADSYNSDFDDDVNDRDNDKDSDESSTATEGLENERMEMREEDDDEEETKEQAPGLQADSDSEIEEIEEVEEPKATNTAEDDHDDEEEDNGSDSEQDEEQESEYEEEDISNDVPVKQPCILVFDSLGGRKDRQARLCAVLRDFLTMEYKEKYPGQKREFSTRTIPGCAPKVPQQPNLTDCGIYVCHNVETFFKNPIKDYTLPIRSLKNWFPDSEPRVKRRDVATLIKQLATEQNKDKLEQLILPDLVFVEPEKPKPAPVSTPGQRSDGEDDMDDDYISDDEYYSDDEERNNKRYRSDESSDEDRSPQRRRPNDSEDEFDPGAVYGAQGDPSPIRRLPPGISVVRSGHDNGSSAGAEPYANSPRQNYPTPLRKLPPGISISRQQTDLPNLPPGVTISSQRVQEPVSQSTPSQKPAMSPFKSFLSSQSSPAAGAPVRRVFSSGITVQGDVTMEDVSDCSDEATIFDLDQPDYTRTFLSPNSFQALKELRNQQPASSQDKLNSSFSMVSHQVAESVIDSCLASMVAHQVFVINEEDVQEEEEEEILAQVDGMNDFDSEDDTLGEPAESVPVNEPAEAAVIVPAEEASEDINPPEVVQGTNEEYSLPETTEQHNVVADQKAFQDEDMIEAAEVYPEEFQEEVPQEVEAQAQIGSEDVYNIPTEVSADNVVPVEVVNPVEEGIANAFEAAVADAVVNDLVNVTEEVPVVENVDILNVVDAEESANMEDLDRSEEYNDEDDEEFVSEYDEEDSRDGRQEGYQAPQVKRARMSSDAEVVLDSDDDDDQGAPAQPQQLPAGRVAPPAQAGVYPGYPGHMMAMTQQQHYMAAQQQAMMMGRGQFPGMSQAMMMVQQQQQQQLRQMQQLQAVNGGNRKRKLPSVALCIKDGRVYNKPFSQLHPALVNNNSDKEKLQLQAPAPQQHQVYHAAPSRQQQQHNPYAPAQPSLNQPQPGPNPLSAVSQLYQRLGQKPPASDNDRNSVDNDDYRSDEDDFEVMDGQEINEDEESRDESYHSDDIQSYDDITEVHDGQEDSKDSEAVVPSSANPVVSNPPDISDESADVPDDSEVNTENEASNDADKPESDVCVGPEQVPAQEESTQHHQLPQEVQPLNDPIAEAIYSAEVNHGVMEASEEISNEEDLSENDDSQQGGVSL